MYRFGLFEFDAATLQLRRQGSDVGLEPQPARALARLLARAGDVVSRDDLKDEIWPKGTHVDFDRGLAYVISQIRAALGDSADNPRFVQTLPRRGYRFIAPVEVVAGSHAAPLSAASEPQPRQGGFWGIHRDRRTWAAAALVLLLAIPLLQALRPSKPVVIAVSIFDNETGLPEHDRLVMALSDLVVTRLTELGSDRLAIVGNAAVLRQPRNIRNLAALREQLEADYVLLGQLQRDEAGFRFITHFIRLSDEAHLKANRLAFPDGDLRTLEAAVVDEFDQAVHTYVIDGSGS